MGLYIFLQLFGMACKLPAFYTCDVSHHVTCIGTFSKWPSIKRQKKFALFFCSFRILKPKKSVLAKKRRKIWRQLPTEYFYLHTNDSFSKGRRKSLDSHLNQNSYLILPIPDLSVYLHRCTVETPCSMCCLLYHSTKCCLREIELLLE